MYQIMKDTKGTTIKTVADNASAIKSWGKAGNGLSKLNTLRGGLKGNKGFVAEELQAAIQRIKRFFD